MAKAKGGKQPIGTPIKNKPTPSKPIKGNRGSATGTHKPKAGVGTPGTMGGLKPKGMGY